MNLRNAVMTVLACLTATALAIASLDRVCSWLVDDAGSTTRAAVMLANAPLFGAGGALAPAALETTSGARDIVRGSRRAGRPASHDPTTGR